MTWEEQKEGVKSKAQREMWREKKTAGEMFSSCFPKGPILLLVMGLTDICVKTLTLTQQPMTKKQ